MAKDKDSKPAQTYEEWLKEDAENHNAIGEGLAKRGVGVKLNLPPWDNPLAKLKDKDAKKDAKDDESE